MSIFKAVSLFITSLSLPAEFFQHHSLLQQLLGVNPQIRFIDETAADGAVPLAGRARLDKNRVEINLSRFPANKGDLSDTLAHEMRHIWQNANSCKAFPLEWCREKADWAKYWAYSKDQHFLLDVMGVHKKHDSQDIGYLMCWKEVDARAYAAWFLYEREKGLPFVGPESDRDMLTRLIARCGGRTLDDVPDSFIFDAFLERMFLAEARIQRAYVNAGLYDKEEAK